MMKKLMILMCLLSAFATSQRAFADTPEEPEDVTLASSQETVAWTDTIAVIKDAHSIVITEQGDKTTLVVNGSGSDNKFYYRYAIEPRVDTVVAPKQKIGVDVPFAGNIRNTPSAMRFIKNIYVGCNMPVGPGNDLKAGWEIGVGEVLGFGYSPNGGRTTLSAGFGFCYRTLKTSHGLVFGKEGATLTLAAAPEGCTDSGASIRFWQLQFPFLITQTTGKSFGFNFGVIVNLNVSATAQNRWQQEDMTIKTGVDNLHQRFFTPDLFMSVGIPGTIGGYIKFSPVDAMLHYRGPRMSMLSAGVNFNF